MQGYLKPLRREHSRSSITHTYMCGLCHALGEQYGFIYRIFARTDLIFFNVFMDAVARKPAPFVNRACPLLPIVAYPIRAKTDHTRFTAAFGVYMGVEKLRDDFEDEGGLHRWLLWQLFKPGFERARRVLRELDFAVEQIDRWMAINGRIEKRREASLRRAVLPSAIISGILFAFAARATDGATTSVIRQIGQRVGAFLFFMDSVLDYFADRRAGHYNPLTRLPPATSRALLDDDAAIELGVRHAAAEVEALGPLLADARIDDPHGLIRCTLVDGFRDKVARYRALTTVERLRATLRDVEPPPPGPLEIARRAWNVSLSRARLAVALLVSRIAPRSPQAAKAITALLIAASVLAPDSAAAADGGVGAGTDGGMDGGVDAGVPPPSSAGNPAPPAEENEAPCAWCCDGCGNCGGTVAGGVCGACCSVYENCGCGQALAMCPCTYCCLVCK